MTAIAASPAPSAVAGVREMTYVEAARAGLDEEMARDPRIFVVGQGIGARGGNFNTTLGLYEKYGPARLRDVPITERGFVGMCTGAAATGSRPVVDFMFVDFILDAVGELINQATKLRYMTHGRVTVPLVLRGCFGLGGAAATHHSGSYYSLFAHLPGFVVALPSTPADAKGLLKAAIRCDDPVIVLEHKGLLNARGPVPDDPELLVPFGVASVRRHLSGTGRGVTVVALANMVAKVLAAAERVAHEGIDVEVIDPRTIAPLDIGTIAQSVRRTSHLLIVDEDYAPFGVGAEIAAAVGAEAFDHLDAPIRRLNAAFTHVPYSPPLETAVSISADQIDGAIRGVLRG
jgi:2-oxoisovalerate dehydrogenase E1 component